MNAAIVYHSSTGNTRHCAEVIGSSFEACGHDCALLDTREARKVNLKSRDLLGFASAVYGFRPAHAMTEFLRDMGAIEGKPAFLLACCSLIPAKSLLRMAKMVSLKGGLVLGGIEVRGEEAWPALRFPKLLIGRGRPSAEDDARMSAFAEGIVARYERVTSGADVEKSHFRWFSPWGLIGMITTRPVMRYAMLGKMLNEEKCTRCGECASACAMDAIRLDPYPTFSRRCMGCFGCVNLCPEEAISTPLTWGRVRYKGYGAGRGADSSSPEEAGDGEGAGADKEELDR